MASRRAAVPVAVAGGLEALEKDLQGLADLLAEPCGDIGLALAAHLEQLEGRRRLGHAAHDAVGVQQLAQGAEHVAAGGCRHVADAELDPAGGVARGAVDQAQALAVGEQAHRHPGLAQQALEFGCRWIMPGGRLALGGVEVEAGGQFPDQHLIGLAGAGGRGVFAGLEGGGRRISGLGGAALAVRDRQRGAQLGALLGEAQEQVLGLAVGAVELVLGPAEEAEQAGAQVEDAGVGCVRPVVVGVGGDGPDCVGREGVGLGGAELLHDAAVAEHGHAEGQALARLGLAEPGLVEDPVDVEGHDQRVSGTR
jgi:hypothetical protein